MTLPDRLPAPLAAALSSRGYDTLTPVQEQVIAPETEGRDLLVSAQTGSGKTVAFGLAIAPTLLQGEDRLSGPGAPLALAIAPTRELAMQVGRELSWLYAETGARIAYGVGGMDIRTERRAFERGAQIVVGTPGRLRDHISKGALDLSALRAIVLDEADEMLDLGFREDLEFILAAAPETRRTLMFSATVPKAIAELAENYQQDALRLAAARGNEPHADIDYVEMVVRAEEKEHAVVNTLLLYEDRNAIIFCHTREAVKHLAARLLNRGFAVVAISGELSQAERSHALQAMRDGRARICVATDVAARGIDLPSLDLVIHADVPANPDTLKHRSGRTGRAGRKGTSVLIVPRHRRAAINRTLGFANVTATARSAPTIPEIEALQRASILARAETVSPPAEEDQALIREILERLPPEALAAQFLAAERARRPAAEEVSDEPVPPLHQKGAKRDARPREEFPREPRESMEGGRWFTLSLGRRQRADPKWLLPMICKAGGITRRAVGSIKIGETETRFQISAGEADAFAQKIGKSAVAEGNVVIAPADGDRPAPGGKPPRAPRPEKAPFKADFKSDFKGKPRFADDAAPESKPQWKGKPKPARPTESLEQWAAEARRPGKKGPPKSEKPSEKPATRPGPGTKPRKKKGYDPLA